MLLLIIVSALVSGCTHTYVMKLQNGMQLTTASKPKLKNGVYVYKDALGRDQYVPAGSVREIEPASMAQEEQGKFKPSGK